MATSRGRCMYMFKSSVSEADRCFQLANGKRSYSVVFTDHCSFMTHHTLIQSRKKFICSNVLIPGRFNMKLMDSIWRNIFASLRPAYCCNLWFSFIYSPRSQWICLWPSTMDDTDRLFIGNFIFVLLKKYIQRAPFFGH